jgi:hypothetical protein
VVPGLRRPQARRRRPDNAEARRTIGVKLHNVADHSCDWQMSLKGRMWRIITAWNWATPRLDIQRNRSKR